MTMPLQRGSTAWINYQLKLKESARPGSVASDLAARGAELDAARALGEQFKATGIANRAKADAAGHGREQEIAANAARAAVEATRRTGVTPEAKKANLSKQTKATSGNVGYQNMLALQRANAARDRREQQSLTRFFTSMIYAWPPSIGVVVSRGRR